MYARESNLARNAYNGHPRERQILAVIEGGCCRNKAKPKQNDDLGSYSTKLNLRAVECQFVLFSKGKSTTRFFYKKPSSRPSTKSFSIFGHILVLKICQFSELKLQ